MQNKQKTCHTCSCSVIPTCHIYRSWSTPRERVWYVWLKETSIKYSAIISLHKHIRVRTTLLCTTPVYLLPVLRHPSLCWNLQTWRLSTSTSLSKNPASWSSPCIDDSCKCCCEHSKTERVPGNWDYVPWTTFSRIPKAGQSHRLCETRVGGRMVWLNSLFDTIP